MGFDALFPITVMQGQVFIVKPSRAVVPIAVVIMLGGVHPNVFFGEFSAMAQGVVAIVLIGFQIMLHKIDVVVRCVSGSF